MATETAYEGIAMKTIRRYFQRLLNDLYRETYTCHICKTDKPKFEMQNIVTQSYRDRSNPHNCCKGCFSMTDETPFLYCEACGQSSPYHEMTLIANQEHKPGHKRIWVHLGDCPTDDISDGQIMQIAQRTAELQNQRIIP